MLVHRATCQHLGSKAVILASFVVLGGCGMLKKHASDNHGGGGTNFSLTGDEQKSLAAWQSQLIKSCDTGAAFAGKSSTGDAGIDAKQFLALSAGSFALHKDASFVLFGSPTDLTGTSESKISRDSQTNGKTTDALGAQMTRDGGHCKVVINGATVYETQLWATLPVIAAGEGTLAQPFSVTSPFVATDSVITQHGLVSATLGAVARAGTSRSVLKALLPAASSAVDAGADTSNSSAVVVFPLSGLGDGSYAVDSGIAGAPKFDRVHPEITGPAPALAALSAATGTATLTMDVAPTRYTVQLADPQPLANANDSGIWRLAVSVDWSGPANNRAYHVNKVEWSAVPQLDATAFSQCFTTRYNLFAPTSVYGQGAYAPAFDGALGPCAVYTQDLGASFDGDAGLRQLLTKTFAGTKGNADLGYQGWDTPLTGTVAYELAHGESPHGQLDVKSASPLITDLDHYGSAIASGVSSRQILVDQRDELLNRLAFNWALKGISADLDVGALLDALANVHDLLPTSSWLDSLTAEPFTSVQQRRIDYAKGLSPATKSALGALLQSADSMQLRAVVNDTKLANAIIDQTDLSDAKIASWQATLTAASAFRDRDHAKAGDMVSIFASDFESLAHVAVTEDWTSADFDAADKIALIAKSEETCNFYAATSTLVRCAGITALSKKDGGLLAPSFAGRYVDLSGDITKDLAALSDPYFFETCRDLREAYYQPLWQGCDASAFANNRSALSALIDKLATSDYDVRFELQQQLTALFGQCSVAATH